MIRVVHVGTWSSRSSQRLLVAENQSSFALHNFIGIILNVFVTW